MLEKLYFNSNKIHRKMTYKIKVTDSFLIVTERVTDERGENDAF